MRYPRRRPRAVVPIVLLSATLFVPFVGAPGGQPVEAQAAFPGKNGKIAFASDRVTPDNPEGDYEIFTMNPDGTGLRQLTHNAAGDFDPVWSSDGRLIAFASIRDGNLEVYTIRADGSQQTNRTNNPAIDQTPAWSPDGKQIAFMSDRDGNLEIYVMDANGANQTRLTADAASDVEPDWSPDGSKLAFASERDGNREIYVMNAGGANPTRLTTTQLAEFAPVWSPNGARIAFMSAGSDTTARILTMAADGSDRRRLTRGSDHNSLPDWQAKP
jgi:Tol biopolymer transport system component